MDLATLQKIVIVRQVVKRVRNFVRNLSCNGLHCKLLKKIVSCSSPLSCLEILNLLEDVMFYLMLRFKDFFPALVTLPMIQVEVQNTFTLEWSFLLKHHLIGKEQCGFYSNMANMPTKWIFPHPLLPLGYTRCSMCTKFTSYRKVQ